MKKNDLSAVMSVYKNDSPVFFQQAIDSVLKQTLQPKEFIIVVDGPVGNDLNDVIALAELHPYVKIVRLEQNCGAGAARKIAIRECTTEFVALMDADDICIEDRFEIQMHEFNDENIGVVGGRIEEFKIEPGDLGIIRDNPTTPEEIYSFGKWRNPINHVTLMYRMSHYNLVGGYSNVRHIEDWELISRFLVNQVSILNIPKTLVHVRSSNAMVVRRRKWPKFFGRMAVFWVMYRNKYFGLHNYLGNVLIFVVLRLLPAWITANLYKNVLRKKNN